MGLHQAADSGGRAAVASPRRQTTSSGRAAPAERKSVVPAPLHHSAQLKPIAVNAELAVAVHAFDGKLNALGSKAVPGVRGYGMPSTMRGARSNVLETNSSS